MFLIIEFLVSALAILIATKITPGVSVDTFFPDAMIVAVVLALVNLVIGGIARTLTAPLNFLTLGFISFLISGLMVIITAKIVPGFHVNGYIAALIFALVLAIIRGIFGMIIKK
jgi:putative membrane protein